MKPISLQLLIHLFLSFFFFQTSGRWTVYCTFGIWLLSIVLGIPGAIVTSVVSFDLFYNETIEVCYIFPDTIPIWYRKFNVISKIFIYYLIPLVAIAYFYLLMSRYLIVSAKAVPGKHGIHKQVQSRRKVAKVVLCFVLIFAVCFLPNHVFVVWFHLNYPQSEMMYNAFWHYFRIVGFCLSFLNSCINPLALYAISGTFRMYYNQYLFCWCCSKEPLSDRWTLSREERFGGSRLPSTRHSCAVEFSPRVRKPSSMTSATLVASFSGSSKRKSFKEMSCINNSSLAVDSRAQACSEEESIS